MKHFVRIFLFSILFHSFLAAPVTRGDDPDDKEEKEHIEAAKKLGDAVKKLVDAVENGKDVAKAAADLDKKDSPTAWNPSSSSRCAKRTRCRPTI